MTDKSNYYHRHLPHFFIPEACYFVTYRLANSLPNQKLKILKSEYQSTLSKIESMKISQNEIDKQTTNAWKRYFDQIDNLLTKYSKSPQFLQNPQIANIIAESLKYYDGNDYELICYCVMPNHVHCVFKLKEQSRPLHKIMHSIKRFSAVKSNKILYRTGQFWQHENYDHIIHTHKELENIIGYILNNPVKAGFIDSPDYWKWNYSTNIPL